MKALCWATLISVIILILLVIGVVVMMIMGIELDYTFTFAPLACVLIMGGRAIKCAADKKHVIYTSAFLLCSAAIIVATIIKILEVL